MDNGTQTFASDPDGQRLKRTRGGQTATLSYGAFGKVRSSTGTLGTDRKYTQQRDEDVAATATGGIVAGTSGDVVTHLC